MKEMIEGLLKAGGFRSDEPLDSIARIVDSAESPPPAFEVCSYAWLLAYFGQWDRAEAVARSIKDDEDERGLALATLAQRLAAADLADRAESVARSIPIDAKWSGSLVETVVALTKIASKSAQAGQPARAEGLLREAEAALKQLGHPDHLQASLLDDIAEAWMLLNRRDKSLGLWDEAIVVARQSVEIYRAGGAPDVDSWKVLAAIARRLAELGEDERSKLALQAIDNDDWRKRAITQIRSHHEE